MNRVMIALLLSVSSSAAFSADNDCLSQKYDAYIEASMHWYEDLSQLTAQQYPDLKEVSQWYLDARRNHFDLNAAAVKYYLANDATKVATQKPVEAWLQLEQKEIKALAERDDELGQIAAKTFADRQAVPHKQNYELRSAFADLLSHPTKIDEALQRYNTAIAQVELMSCN
ncbi:hypothetical protein VII00023_17544 [Vibrio ichthyoenteri ATCC 700023]|uniref:Uncharacterized protein n=1 Tax=Vibrio ichthyoenteri ATCC 700023 TaxID=870968 RepID=F9RXG8_9VIBR|nr:hypothetical protein [Vibrio ichthyoenteri]EGU48064.1 hypothetical protein VII00023_17544 [Vibrio ichthyoenteri ATCC 700023]